MFEWYPKPTARGQAGRLSPRGLEGCANLSRLLDCGLDYVNNIVADGVQHQIAD
jgi:hypothetical protein